MKLFFLPYILFSFMELNNMEASALLDVLKTLYPDSSMTTLRDWIKKGRVTVDGLVVKIPSTPVAPKQKVELQAQAFRVEILSTCKILYEDNDLVVVEKKAGSLSVATKYQTENTVHEELKTRYKPNRVFVIHRLDQGTSGVMLFARNQKSFENLKKQLEKRTMHREYVAIVKGVVEEREGTWKSYLYEDPSYQVRTTDDPEEGEEAITHFKILASKNPFSVLHAKLETGKKNQIRVHCQEAGIPILGDERYGGDMKAAKRLMLHAFLLEFVHPSTGKKMSFNSSIPPSFTYFVSPTLWLRPPMTSEVKHGQP